MHNFVENLKLKIMKKNFSIGFIVLSLLFGSIETQGNYLPQNNDRSRYKKCQLKLHRTKRKPRSVAILPVSMFQNSHSLLMQYQQSLEDVGITIFDDLGEAVYTETQTPIAGSQYLIDIFDWNKGSYIITFSGKDDLCIWGEFEI